MNDDTQAFEPKPTFSQKYLRYFKMPRFYVVLMKSKDKNRAVFMRGFYKDEGRFSMDRFEVEEKENVEVEWRDTVGIWEITKHFFRELVR